MSGCCERQKFMGAAKLAPAAEPGGAHARDEALRLRAGARCKVDLLAIDAADQAIQDRRRSLRAGTAAGAGSQPADRRALRDGVPGEGLRRGSRSSSGSSPSRSKRKRPAARSSRSSRWWATILRPCSISTETSVRGQRAKPRSRNDHEKDRRRSGARRVGFRLQQGKWRGPTVHTTAGSPGCGRSTIQPASRNRSERDSRADQGARLRRIRRTRARHQR